jgi:hypothetical protein
MKVQFKKSILDIQQRGSGKRDPPFLTRCVHGRLGGMAPLPPPTLLPCRLPARGAAVAAALLPCRLPARGAAVAAGSPGGARFGARQGVSTVLEVLGRRLRQASTHNDGGSKPPFARDLR